ncbi:MAG: beta-N-acetylhexosaminidase [Prevotella sp.]|nr:beta-N-acetylhexosaminidase [Prevotella sp.]
MRKTTLLLLWLSLCLPLGLFADSRVNLTPVPKSMTLGEGTLVLPDAFGISAAGLPDSLVREAVRFADHINKVTGKQVTVADDAKALVQMSRYTGTEPLGIEGYTLDVTPEGIALSANTSTGFFYAFQSIKKMLPPCVMAGVKDENVTEYALPVVSITDAPRFEYRGFMLDVSRHFFTLDELKRMLDVMSYYKMNRFHWHLTDDQGWRIEIKKYPKLIEIGSVRPGSWDVDPVHGRYFSYEPYGPYFYTQDEARELVAYAKERHIEVIPEVEFPGHACAAVTCYPEFSCWPEGSHEIKLDGGIFSDVLNVANPGAIQFAKDVLDELTDIFPFEQIHIGGDECPTSAWEGNAECRAKMQELGLGTNYRALQSHFVRELSDHVSGKTGDKRRRVIMWNESLSSTGSDESLIQGTGGTIMCWEDNNGKVQSSALKAAQLGLKSVITPWGPYYINRKQSTDPGEPHGAGGGADDVRATYSYVPVPASVPANLRPYYSGVQGTFWCEHVSSNYLLEYLALPRLIAIAETGWTPAEKKNFDDFCARITADSVLLNYNNYAYGRHFMNPAGGGETEKVMPVASTDEEQTWYRIVTRNTGDANRAGKCIELLREGSPIIGTGNACAGRLWSALPAAEGEEAYDWQQWAVMEDPDNAGHYALVCKARPQGSLNGTPTAANNTGRWDYDEAQRHYDFVLGDRVYQQNGNNYCYSIRSEKAPDLYLNMAAGGQNYSINLWGDPADGNSGVWEFQMTSVKEPLQADYPEPGDFIRIANAVERFSGIALMDDGKSSILSARVAPFAADVWEVVSADDTADGRSVTLRNKATGRYVSGNTSPLALGDTPSAYTFAYTEKEGDYRILADSKAIFPISVNYHQNPGTVYVDGKRPQGAAWTFERVCQVTYQCYDGEGNLLATHYQAAPKGKAYVCTAPDIENWEVESYEETGTAEAPVIDEVTDHRTVKVTYRRTAYTITVQCVERRGGIIREIAHTVPVNASVALSAPELKYYTLVSTPWNEGDGVFTPTEDTTVRIVYATEGVCGFKAVGRPVTELADGQSYVLYDTRDDNSRRGFLGATSTEEYMRTNNGIKSGSPAYVWGLEKSGTGYKVGNGLGLYIPMLVKGSAMKPKADGATFTFTLNADGQSWDAKGSNNLHWNANSDHTFTGWTDCDPYLFYSYYVEPYFTVTCICRAEDGTELQRTSRLLVAGSAYTLEIPAIEGYEYKSAEGDTEGLDDLSANREITLVYAREKGDGIVSVQAGRAQGELYDLEGRKVARPVKEGVYIRDGRKVVIRK